MWWMLNKYRSLEEFKKTIVVKICRSWYCKLACIMHCTLWKYISLGTSAFYQVLWDCHGISTETVHRAVNSVCGALFDLRENFIHWPENPQHLANKFYLVSGMPSCGLIDGSHILITPPADDEDAFINWQLGHCFNVCVVCGPNLKIYHTNYRAPGRWHDSRVRIILNVVILERQYKKNLLITLPYFVGFLYYTHE
jgi:hypothetical protein